MNTNRNQFPGAYKATDPYANFSIYNGAKDFPFPGPEVWDGAGSSSSAPSTGSSSGSESSAPVSSAAASASSAPSAPSNNGWGVQPADTTQHNQQQDSAPADGECGVEYVYV